MTDKEIYLKFSKWMGMEIQAIYDLEDERELIVLEDVYKNVHPKFHTLGYDEFRSSAIFNKKGELVKGHMDSHVAYSSKYADDIRKIINANK